MAPWDFIIKFPRRLLGTAGFTRILRRLRCIHPSSEKDSRPLTPNGNPDFSHTPRTGWTSICANLGATALWIVVLGLTLTVLQFHAQIEFKERTCIPTTSFTTCVAEECCTLFDLEYMYEEGIRIALELEPIDDGKFKDHIKSSNISEQNIEVTNDGQAVRDPVWHIINRQEEHIGEKALQLTQYVSNWTYRPFGHRREDTTSALNTRLHYNSCALVGHVLHGEEAVGAEIESHDAVFRFYHTAATEHKLVGRKATFIYYSSLALQVRLYLMRAIIHSELK